MQRLDKGFRWSLEAEAFSWCIVVIRDDGVEAGFWQVCKVCFSGKCASESSDGIFDAPFLPRRVWIAEVGLDVEQSRELLVSVELGTPFDCPPAAGAQDRIVEGYGLAQVWREGFEHLDKTLRDGIGLEVGLREGDSEARVAFMGDKDGRSWL